MLLPQLLFPDSVAARLFTPALLGIGGTAVLALLLAILFVPADRRGRNHCNGLKLDHLKQDALTEGPSRSE